MPPTVSMPMMSWSKTSRLSSAVPKKSIWSEWNKIYRESLVRKNFGKAILFGYNKRMNETFTHFAFRGLNYLFSVARVVEKSAFNEDDSVDWIEKNKESKSEIENESFNAHLFIGIGIDRFCRIAHFLFGKRTKSEFEFGFN